MPVVLTSRLEQDHLVTVRQRQLVATDSAGSNLPARPIGLSVGSNQRAKAFDLPGFRMRYLADIAAGAIKLRESRAIADLLIRGTDAAGWREAIVADNVLQPAIIPGTAG